MEPIVSRESISNQAHAAAACFVQTGQKPAPLYPSGSDAAMAFQASFERWLLALTAPEGVDSSC